MANSTRATTQLLRCVVYALLLGLLLNSAGHAFTHLCDATAQPAPITLRSDRNEQPGSSLSGNTHACSGCESLRHLRLTAAAPVALLIAAPLATAQWELAVAASSQQSSQPPERAPPQS